MATWTDPPWLAPTTYERDRYISQGIPQWLPATFGQYLTERMESVMPRGKKAENIKKETARKDRVTERQVKEAIQVLPADKAPAENKLIDKPKGDANGKK